VLECGDKTRDFASAGGQFGFAHQDQTRVGRARCQDVEFQVRAREAFAPPAGAGLPVLAQVHAQTVPESYLEQTVPESYLEQLFLLIAETQVCHDRAQTVPESYLERTPRADAQTVPESYLEQLFLLIAETQVCHDRFASFPRMPS